MARTPKVVENRREQIMEAALRVFARKGFARASNKDIAREAEITPGLIYHYFASKEALLQAIIEARAPMQVTRASVPAASNLPPEKMLRYVLLEILRALEEEKFIQLLRVYLSELLYNPNVSPLGIPAIQEGTGYLEKYLTTQMKRGVLKKTDPVLVTQFIMGSLMSTLLRRHILQDPVMLAYSHEQIVNALVQVAMHGLTKE